MKILITLIVILLNINLMAQDFAELTSSALNAVKNKDYYKAIELYNKALELDADNHHIYYRLSLIYYYLNKLDSSVSYCDKILKLVPNDIQAHYQRGHCYLNKENYELALTDFQTVFELSGNKNADASFNIGKSYQGINDYSKAIPYFKQTLLLQPQDKFSFYQLGFSYASLSFPEKDSALKYYDLAILHDNNYFEAYLNRGLLFATHFKDSYKAHLDFEKSIEINPNNKLSYMYNGFLYRNDAKEGAEENLFKSRNMFDKVIELFPDYADAYFERAFIWYTIGILNMACKDLNKAEELGHKKAIEIKKQFCK